MAARFGASMTVDAVAFVACGWSLASENAHATSIALDTGGETVVVDAGGGVTKGLVRTFGTANLDHVYLTHEHPDHTYALPGLIHHLRFDGERGPLHVHGPPPALTRVRDALEALGVTCPFEIHWDAIPVEPGSDDRATWAPADHSVPTLAYRFEDVVICGDTGPSETIAELARGASLLVHEASHTNEELTHGAGHSTPTDAGEIAAQADVGALALIHIHPSLGREKATTACPFTPVFAPKDGDVLVNVDGTWQHKEEV